MVVGIALQVGGTDAGVPHDGGGGTWLEGGRTCAVAAVVLGVVAAVLVPHFMRHVVHVERVPDGRTLARHAARLVAAAWRLQVRNAATTCGEHMADVVVGRPDHVVAGVDVLSEHGAPTSVVVGVRGAVQEDQLVVVGHNFHGQTRVPLKDAVHANHGGVHRGEHAAHVPAVVRGVFSSACQRQAVRSQLRAVVHAACRRDRLEAHGLNFLASRMGLAHGGLDLLARLGKFQRHAPFGPLRGACVEVGTGVHNDMLPISGRVGVDEHGFPDAHDHGMKTLWRQVKPDRGLGRVQALTGIHLNVREPGRKLGGHDGAVDHAKTLHPAVGHGQREHRLRSSSVERRRMGHFRQPSLQTRDVQVIRVECQHIHCWGCGSVFLRGRRPKRQLGRRRQADGNNKGKGRA